MSLKGVSIAFIGTTKSSAITNDIYINKCLSQLRSFIEEHHADDEYRFWPNLASSHYVNETMQWHLQQKIKFVAGQVSPTNVRQDRLIEQFLLTKYIRKVEEAKTKLHLRSRIYQKIKQIDMKIVQHMMTSIRTKLRKIEV